MADTRKTPFRDKMRTFADIHKAGQEDWILALFQRLCISVQSVDWTSPQFDETKLTVAQNLVCVDKCYKRWREDWNAIGASNIRPIPVQKPVLPFQPSSAPAPINPLAKNSVSPTHFGSSGLLKKIEGIDISDPEDYNFHTTQDDSQRSPPQSISPPSQPWTAPDPTRNRYDLKKKHIEILNYTIESKFKAIKAVVDRTARGIQEKRNVNFVLLWLLIENKTHAEEVKYNTINITSLMELISQFKREVINSYEVFPTLVGKENGDSEPETSTTNGPTSPLKANGEGDIQWKATAPATTKGGWNRVGRPVGPPTEPKEVRLPPPAMLRGAKPSEIVKEGWMKKQSNKSRTWKRRYFILSSDAILAYFQCRKKPGILGTHHNSNSPGPGTSYSAASSGSSSSSAGSAPSSPLPSLGGKESTAGKVLGKMKASFDIWRATQIGAIRDPDSSVPPTGAFGIETPDNKIRLWCETEKEMEEWLEILLKLRAQSRW